MTYINKISRGKILAVLILAIWEILTINIPVSAKPYLYYYSSKPDVTGELSSQSDIYYLNLTNNDSGILLSNTGVINKIKWEPTQNWLLVDANDEVYAVNLRDTTKYLEFFDEEVDFGGFLYSQKNNKFYLFWSPINSSEEYLSVYSLNNSAITLDKKLKLQYTDEIRNELNEECFFSSDENMVFFSDRDQISNQREIVGFSTQVNEIVMRKNLAEIAMGSKAQRLEGGQKGSALITFRTNAQEKNTLNYLVYNTADNQTSPSITCPVNSRPHLSPDAKYLIIEQENTDAERMHYSYPGSVSVYDVSSGRLKKQISFPPEGRIYVFNNAANMFYYCLPEEKRSVSVDVSKLIPSYKLNINLLGNGTVIKSPEQISYDSSAVVTLKANPEEGYIFKNWMGDIQSKDNPLVLNMDSDKNITSVFVLKPVLKSLNPYFALEGMDKITLSANGTAFTNSLSVLWNGQERTTSYISETQLQAFIPKEDLQKAGNAEITVRDENGTLSNPLIFKVITRAEMLDSLNIQLNSSCDKNLIGNKDLCNSLQKKIDNAASDLKKNNLNSAKGIIEAFLNELEARKDKQISAETFSRLSYYAEILLKSF